jgi:hypothetical protein
MSFGSRADKCRPLYNYKHALLFFTRYPKPRSSNWQETERPIYISDGKPNPSMRHYRMERGPINPVTHTPEYFDLKLHSTSVIRYMAPTEDGKRVVYLTYGGWPTLMTRTYMAHHGWYYGQAIRTTDGTDVAVPINFDAKSTEWIDNQWLAKLTFSENSLLIVAESDHMQVFKRRSGQRDKELRATMRRKMDLIHDMMWFSIESTKPDLEDAINSNYKYRYALLRAFGPFTSPLEQLRYEYAGVLRSNAQEFLSDDVEFSEPTLEALRALYLCVYHHRYGQFVLAEGDADNPDDSSNKLLRQSTIQKVVDTSLMALLNIKNGKEFVPLPKFMLADEFPKTHFTTDSTR